MRFDRATTARLDQQAGAISRHQLLGHGYSGAQIDAMLRRGHLERAAHGVYRRTGSGWDPRQEAVVAVLRCRPRARIAGLRLLGLLGVEGVEVDASFIVLVPPGRRVRNVPFAVRPDLAPQLHRAHYGPVPGVTPARNLVELAADGTRPDDDVLGLMDRMRWRGVLTTTRVATTLRPLDDHPGATRLRRLLDLGATDQESHGERDLHAVTRDLEPPLEWQVWLAPDLRVDALWRDCALVVEYQGRRFHTDPRDREQDRSRHARIRALGYDVVVVEAVDVQRPEALRARLLAARRARIEALATSTAPEVRHHD